MHRNRRPTFVYFLLDGVDKTMCSPGTGIPKFSRKRPRSKLHYEESFNKLATVIPKVSMKKQEEEPESPSSPEISCDDLSFQLNFDDIVSFDNVQESMSFYWVHDIDTIPIDL